ncbi:MAG: RNA-binding protein [Alphaproteobacteria bacterium]|nr:RNA-binding protein [Alphaproteobacteria bacterium]
MPKGPRGERRPADVVSAAVMVGKIATGEAADSVSDEAAITRGRLGGKKGGKARAVTLTPTQRKVIAQAAANKRWKKGD